MTALTIRLHQKDSVAIALQDLEQGQYLPDHDITLTTQVKRGHKFALSAVAAGDKLLRYGQIIGQALEPIAVAKGDRAPVAGLNEYAQPNTTPGFIYMDNPGYDPASVTGQIASGANLIAFTTGRGSVSGFKPAPGLKLAINTEMYTHKAEDMDINCGDIITGGVSIADKGREIFETLVAGASGKQTKSEDLGFGGAEFVPWQIGAVM